ncbi:MAG: cytochrome-c oxidase, cbb3-type subunit III [Burkholderiaceae bacterium]|jgi:cytochrome c oxidase cbb3-type subunit 3|nr:cytochrome-c oxidase, cbb3-type subunit III [Burkholderiaceae bacterium]
MSDFTNNFWSIYVAVITTVGVLGCLVLLWISGKTQAMTTKDNSTGHVWDGDLREMNNPLPRWWVGLFIITCLFGGVYLALYPGLGSYDGALKWSSHGQFDSEVAAGEAREAPIYEAFAGKSIEDLSKDQGAMAIGDRLFMNNCSQCHGSDARGANPQGFPDLTDTQWNWGGTPDSILTTITQGRTGVMTPMAAAVGTPEDVRNVANYVLSLSGKPADPVRAKLGSEKFALCAACHGPEGKGMKELGSANLAAGIFVHGPATEAHIIDQINNGKTGVMPAWEGKFTPGQLRVLAAYVWGKGGGEPAAAAN